MKRGRFNSFLSLLLFALILVNGCAHTAGSRLDGESPVVPAGGAVEEQHEGDVPGDDVSVDVTEDHLPEAGQGDAAEEEFEEDFEEEETEEISDPLYVWNRAMFHFNDFFYTWLLKPAARAYSFVVPEGIRIMIRNFFVNVTTPVRFVNSLLQGKFRSAGEELARFGINTTAGVFGFVDVAKDLGLKRHDEDLGQTLGSYGIGHGFYFVWPILGPSSLRDSIGLIGDWFLDPVTYVEAIDTYLSIKTVDTVNRATFTLGDYEALKKAAFDPYSALRDAYIQNRRKAVDE